MFYCYQYILVYYITLHERVAAVVRARRGEGGRQPGETITITITITVTVAVAVTVTVTTTTTTTITITITITITTTSIIKHVKVTIPMKYS